VSLKATQDQRLFFLFSYSMTSIVAAVTRTLCYRADFVYYYYVGCVFLAGLHVCLVVGIYFLHHAQQQRQQDKDAQLRDTLDERARELEAAANRTVIDAQQEYQEEEKEDEQEIERDHAGNEDNDGDQDVDQGQEEDDEGDDENALNGSVDVLFENNNLEDEEEDNDAVPGNEEGAVAADGNDAVPGIDVVDADVLVAGTGDNNAVVLGDGGNGDDGALDEDGVAAGAGAVAVDNDAVPGIDVVDADVLVAGTGNNNAVVLGAGDGGNDDGDDGALEAAVAVDDDVVACTRQNNAVVLVASSLFPPTDALYRPKRTTPTL
jgi:hypothetical protein